MVKQVSIVEVGPRDGLQNVTDALSGDQKKAFISSLLQAGFKDIEAGSFVRPDKVPSMAHTPHLAQGFRKQNKYLWYLVPNLKGLGQALDCGVSQIAFFTAASPSFNERNIGMTVKESVRVIMDCVAHIRARSLGIITHWGRKPKKNEVKLRLYISTAIACPYEGWVKPKAVLGLMDKLSGLGFSQVALGDTLGKGTPRHWRELLAKVDDPHFKNNRIAMHCHDTYGTALACVAYGLQRGVRTFDASIGGLGGCPFAPGATGNLATEDLIYFLNQEGMKTGIGLDGLLDVFSPERTGQLRNVSRVFNVLKCHPRSPEAEESHE